MFNFKAKAQQALLALAPRLGNWGMESLYVGLAAATLLPLAQAVQANDGTAWMALGGIVSSLGTNLLAGRLEKWKDAQEAAQDLATLAQDSAGRAEIDAVLEQAQAVPFVQQQLDAAGRDWFARTLRQELAGLGNLPRYEAVLHGNGAIAQDHSVAVSGGIAIGGNSTGDVLNNSTKIINPDPALAAAQTALQRYLSRLRERCIQMPIDAFGGLDGAEQITLDQIYVALDTTDAIIQPILPEDPSQADDAPEPTPKMAPGQSEEQRRPLRAMEAIAQESRMVLLGDPGSGKSTLVQLLAAQVAAARLGQPVILEDATPDLLGRMPMLMVLRELAPRLAQIPLDAAGTSQQQQRDWLVDAVWAQWRAQLAVFKAEACEGLLDEALSNGQGLLIFDGLDEVPEATRVRVRKAVQAVLRHYPHARVVVTCRKRSYSAGLGFEGFTDYTLAELDEPKIKAFVQAWYGCQVPAKYDQQQAEARIADLTQAAMTSLQPLAPNPMLLATMATVHQNDMQLPPERVKLYDRAIDVLLRRWQRHKGVALKPEIETLLRDDKLVSKILETLAYNLHTKQYRLNDAEADLARGDILTTLEAPDLLGQLALVNDFLDFIDQGSGLFIGVGGGEVDGEAEGVAQGKPSTYKFPHRTFQEHLAGRRMIWGGTQARRKEFLARAAEGDFWAVAAELAGESLYYQSTDGKGLFELVRALCRRNNPPATQADWRGLLWAGKMAALAGPEPVRQDAIDEDDDGFLEQRLLKRLVELLHSQHLPAKERAEAGNALAKLGDPRFDPAQVYLPQEPLLGFIDIPAGDYAIGTRRADFERVMTVAGIPKNQWESYEDEINDDDAPVWVERFFMARYPVTVAQYRQFAEPRADSPHKANHPVTDVTWHEALAYCDWLTQQLKAMPIAAVFDQKLGNDWRVTLPSELEWEKAARGGRAGAIFPWGDQPDAGKANYHDTGLGGTSSVGCFYHGDEESHGCLDMIGNVWEWTRSVYDQRGDVSATGQVFAYPYQLDDGREDLQADNSARRTLRGGSFRSHLRLARVACRDRFQPVFRSAYYGFRVAVRSYSSSSPR